MCLASIIKLSYFFELLSCWLWQNQDGKVICSSIPIYGNRSEAGNEKGYVVGMSTCYPQLGSIKIHDGETLTLEAKYNNTIRHSGVMGLFYFLVAEKLPHHHL